MNKTYIIASLVLGLSLIISASILSSALKAHGVSIERAAFNQRPEIPGSLILQHETGRSPVRVEQK